MAENPPEQSPTAPGASNKLSKDASSYTKAANQRVLQELNFAAKQDYDDAQRGFIATLTADGQVTKEPVDQVKILSGQAPVPLPVWNLGKYSFLLEAEPQQAPDTVNPSLWRQARINLYNGLFRVTTRKYKLNGQEVTRGIYQVRAFDLSNMTIVETDTGIIVIDPLISAETAKAALNLYYQALDLTANPPPVVAVIYTHSHIDHYGGVKGVVQSDEVKIYAPDGFLDHAVSENVYAGSAMNRRAIYMYGALLPKGDKGQVDSGLGKTTSAGHSGLIPPSKDCVITKSFEERVIDGVHITFQLAQDTEAPAEMLFHFPQFKALCAAEDMTHNLHNLYSLRGAQVRNAAAWWKVINEAIKLFAKDLDVLFAQHHWPMWNDTPDRILTFLKKQRDLYKYIHDQSLRLLNHGRTMIELSELLVLPRSLAAEWYNRGYYGTVNHDSKAVYQRYLGWYDANPATLHPLPPVAASRKYVEYMGGARAVLDRAHKAFAEGDYRWVAQVVNHVIFAAPDSSSTDPPDPVTLEAKLLQANALEQMGYQAESGPWRNVYLMGARELRHGVSPLLISRPISTDVMSAMTLSQYFDYLGLRFNAPKAEAAQLPPTTINWIVNDDDATEYYALELLDYTLPYTSYKAQSELPPADVTLTLDRGVLDEISTATHVSMSQAFKLAVAAGKIQVQGDAQRVTAILDLLDTFPADFNIVTPRQEQDSA
ncbi:MAG TPA: alkyl sulfatase dimerization domain-containing protein [Pyrinomonadaceae bacterium]|jgi:alkyl sulfatase BDS1-like metallo-beta-lactamase superfamily hydrolase